MGCIKLVVMVMSWRPWHKTKTPRLVPKPWAWEGDSDPLAFLPPRDLNGGQTNRWEGGWAHRNRPIYALRHGVDGRQPYEPMREGPDKASAMVGRAQGLTGADNQAEFG